jgi:hypothetical protein
VLAGAQLAVLTAQFAPLPRQTQPEWSVTLNDDDSILRSAWSPTGSCVAVATYSNIHVVDLSGRVTWTWNYRPLTRYLNIMYSLAVSPSCDAVAAAGFTDYRYVWVGARDGTHRSFKVTGTPWHVEFSLAGDAIAVATGWTRGYLFSSRLDRVRWSGPIHDFPISWPGQASGVAPQSTEFLRQDVEELFGVLWGQGYEDYVTDDGRWRMVDSKPRFYPTTTIELWGPDAGGFRNRDLPVTGTHRWAKSFGCGGAARMTRDAMYVVVSGDAKEPDRNELDCPDDEPTYVFDRDGNTVLTRPADQPWDETQLVEAIFARTGHRSTFLTPESAWQRRRLWEASLLKDEYERRSPDDTMSLATLGRTIRLFRAPK